MDSSHLFPIATPPHHTEFTSSPKHADLQDSAHREDAHHIRDASDTNPADDQLYKNPRLSAIERENFEHHPRPRRSIKDEQTVPMLNIRRSSRRKTLVLCFDGTGNKFHGDTSDSNILKIFRMLDRSGEHNFHYYQPGIGTYVSSASLSTTGSLERLKNWYLMAKDSAVGTSFDQHVVGGYKFLMQYYSAGDNIYMFGFSRGSYTARFLSEMLDWIGLITHGNDEMISFAWRTFSSWKAMGDSDTEALIKQRKAYDFMVSFRETFSRPVRRIRYLGLFDTVNSVPRFENAMMRRVHMPYSAKSSAKIIRHAVSIDERRAKFRSDLISVEGRHKKETDLAKAKHLKEKHERHDKYLEWFHQPTRYKPNKAAKERANGENKAKQYRETARHLKSLSALRYRSHSRSRSKSTARASRDIPTKSRSQSPDDYNQALSMVVSSDDESSDGDEEDQDIQELWFPGGHADIGGGWALKVGEVPLSHVPLVWIVREAKKSGLEFDGEKMKNLGCCFDVEEAPNSEETHVPKIEVSGSPTTEREKFDGFSNSDKIFTEHHFKEMITKAATKGVIHDCLLFGKGLPHMSVASWRIMEWIPFRRMDLRKDGSWKPIRWPLPRGEVRDMPVDAKIHQSAIIRMKADPKYRPGNLIIGGGGRGIRVAPASKGTGKWVVVADEGDIVGECYVREKDERGEK